MHGHSNIGKTLIIAKFLRNHPSVFDKARGVEQRDIIAMQMPATPKLADESELRIDIYPRGATSWYGSAGQLCEEGLVPSDFKWPVANQMKRWAENGLFYSLSRWRPPGLKGPMKLWLDGDYWRVRVEVESERCNGFAAAILYEKRQQLQAEEWRQSPDGWAWSRKGVDAILDKRFCAFKDRFVKPLLSTKQRRTGVN